MIVVRVELHSARTGKVQELARMLVINRGDGTQQLGSYDALVLRGRDDEALDRMQIHKRTAIESWPRLRLHVWNLVATALLSMGYGGKRS
jgi:hypothetical protein